LFHTCPYIYPRPPPSFPPPETLNSTASLRWLLAEVRGHRRHWSSGPSSIRRFHLPPTSPCPSIQFTLQYRSSSHLFPFDQSTKKPTIARRALEPLSVCSRRFGKNESTPSTPSWPQRGA
jgi:hypothetical protein